MTLAGSGARVPLTLVTGPTLAQRESLIAAHLARQAALAAQASSVRSAAILEGLPHGTTILLPSSNLDLHRVAPACLCCTGNLILRVTLNRILRSRPDQLFIGVANLDHLDQLRSWLQHPPYDQLLELTPDLFCT